MELFDKIVHAVPLLGRGTVWCLECGRARNIDAGDCVRSGWPKCCGYTMTIDDPALSEPTEAT